MVSRLREGASRRGGANGLLIRTTRETLLQALRQVGKVVSARPVIPLLAGIQSEVRASSAILLKAVERVSVVAGGQAIRLAVEAGRMELLSRTAEIGEVVDEVELGALHGEGFTI